MLVVLSKDGVIEKVMNKNIVNFYLASPCKARLKVYLGDVYCKRFNITENGVFCEFTSLRDVCNHLPKEYGISPPKCWAHPEYVMVMMK